jgi:hypothetical protein
MAGSSRLIHLSTGKLQLSSGISLSIVWTFLQVIRATCDQVMQMLVEELSPPSRPVKTDSKMSNLEDMPIRDEDVLLALNWKKSRVQIKKRDDQSFEEKKGEMVVEFENTLLGPVDQVPNDL